MEKQKVLKIFSIITILVCLFSFVAGGLGVRDVLNQGNIELDKLNAATDMVDTLDTGVKKLESKRADYNAGKKKVAEGEVAYAAGVKQLADGQATYDAGVKTLAAKQKEYDAGLAKYNAGLKELNSKTAAYTAGKKQYTAGLAQYNAGMTQLNAQTDTYTAGKAQYTAGLAQYNAAMAQYNAGLAEYNKNLANFNAAVAAGLLVDPDKTTQQTALTNAKATLDATATVLAGKATDLANAKAKLDAYEAAQAQLVAAKKQLDAAKVQLDAYEAGQAQLTAAKKQLDDGKKKLADGQAQLDAAKVKLTEGQAALDDAAAQLKAGKAQLAEFEAGQKKVNDGYAKLEKNERISAKIKDGMTPVAAAREVLDEETIEIKDELKARLATDIAILAVALILLIASILTLLNKKINIAFILGIIALVAAIGTNIYGGINEYSEFKLQMVGAIVEGVFALAYTGYLFSYKRGTAPKN